MVTAPTVVPAYKAIMQCTNEQLPGMLQFQFQFIFTQTVNVTVHEVHIHKYLQMWI